MQFEWDEQKRLANVEKHGIDFADVSQVFEFDTYTKFDNRFDYGEIRFLSLGMLFGEVVAISHYEQETYFTKIRD